MSGEGENDSEDEDEVQIDRSTGKITVIKKNKIEDKQANKGQ